MRVLKGRSAMVLAPFALLCVLILAAPAFAAEPPASAGLEQEVADQAVAAIPVDLKMGTVAIGPIEGDGDGRIAHALTGALTRLNRFKVIERRDLDTLLAEQGIQARDWIDPKDRVKFGKVKGVQGLFFGKVAGRSQGWFRDTLSVQLKLDDVERGQVVLARELSAGRWHYGPLLVLGAILVVVLGLLLSVLGRKRTVTQKATLAETDRKERTISTEELAKALGELGRARSVLYAKGLQTEAIRVKDLEAQLRTLRDRIALAPTGTSERHSVGELRQAVGFDQAYRTLVEGVTSTASALCDRVGAGNTASVEQDLLALTNHIREAETTFRNRRL